MKVTNYNIHMFMFMTTELYMSICMMKMTQHMNTNMNERPGKNKCPHNVIEPITIDRDTLRYYCKSCGETMGESVKTDSYNTFIAGDVRELTDKERMELA